MGKHRDVLADLTGEIAKADTACGVVLQGSVAEGCERPDSDIDLFVVCSSDTPRMNEYIQQDNRGNMRIKGPFHGIPVNIGWESVDSLAQLIETDGAAAWFMFWRGKILRDPVGLAKRCQDAMHAWFGSNPRVAEAWARQQAEVRRQKRDPSHAIEYPTFRDFLTHVKTVQKQQDAEPSVLDDGCQRG